MGLFARIIALSAALLVICAGATFVAASGAFDATTTPSQEAVASRESSTDSLIADAQQRLSRDPRSVETLGGLSALYLQKVRETGDPSYYARAETLLQQASAIAPIDDQVLAGQAALALERHDFAGALAIAGRLAKDRASTYGLLGDALLELGRYDEAFDAFQRMADLKPDSAALARIAYARELIGDRAGAIDAMRDAAEYAGSRGENVAWLRVQLGELHFQGGDLAAAEREYALARAALPGYVHALAGLGSIPRCSRRIRRSNRALSTGHRGLFLPDDVIALGDVYAAAGRPDKAKVRYARVEAIDRAISGERLDTGLELAVFFADHGQASPELVARHARRLQAAPSVHAADVLSWVLYKAGRIDEARDRSREALRLGTQDALAALPRRDHRPRRRRSRRGPLAPIAGVRNQPALLDRAGGGRENGVS